MNTYVLRRVLVSIPTIIGITILIFLVNGAIHRFMPAHRQDAQ